MYTRLQKAPVNKSFFLFGPRGTGKTTWVRQTFREAVYLDLLEAGLFNELLAAPQRLANKVPAGYSGWVVIDEVQRVPGLLNEIHRQIENSGLKFVLTGSNTRKLRRKGYNLLAGRALAYSMHPLTAAELGKDFKLEHSMRFGQLPCAYREADPGAYLESYVRTYLKEEIQAEGLARNLEGFARFLEAASFSQAAVLNMSAVSRDCAVKRKAVEDYFTILEDLLIGTRVPVFVKKARRRMSAHPKFYFFDAGVYRAVRPKGPLDMPEHIDGHALETLLFQELTAINAALRLGYGLYYWRTAGNTEVDFVLYGERGIKAFEIKRTGRVNSDMTRSLRAFLKEYPQAKGCFLYGGTRKERDGNIGIIPIADALKNLPEIL
ncbi:MAG: ATP-binding protein [Elusimicrobia bacterium]|nr:ATP-binding protein [Elusimicrobiota bacterium]